MDFFLWGIDLLVAEVPGEDESTQTILQSGTDTYTLSWTTPIIKMLPHLHMKQT